MHKKAQNSMRTLKKDPKLNSIPKFNQSPLQDGASLEIFQNRSVMSYLWSILIFLFNIWTVLTTLFWASIHQLPTGVDALFHVLIECILFFEVIVRIFIRICLKEAHDSLNLQHTEKEDRFQIYTLLLIGSFPVLTIYSAVGDFDETSEKTVIFSRILLIKLLRTFEIKRAITKAEEILFYKKFKTLVLVKFIKNLMIIILVSHLFTCAWLFIQTSITNHAVIPEPSDDNPFGTDDDYLERTEKTNAPLIEQYMDGALWAVGTLTACSFADVTPRTFEEILLSVITLMAGVLLLAMIFSDFASLTYLLNVEKTHSKKRLQRALKLCEILSVPFKIRYKIQAFYARDNYAFAQTQYLPALKDLPQSLHTDIILSLNKDTIGKVNLFNFGSPDLLIGIAKLFYPKVSMAGDFILRTGDDAEEMFFIKQGEVEVLATDNKTRIAILREGAYFGEIGLLLTQKRTVSVRALTVCVFEVLSKSDFTKVLETYPEQKKLLLQVASQRVKVCSPQDIKPENILEESQLDLSKEFEMRALEDNEDNANSKGKKRRILEKGGKLKMHLKRIVERFQDNACMTKDLDFRNLGSLIILPTSNFGYLWAGIMGLALFANLIIIPYEVSFGEDHEHFPTYWRTIDIIVLVLYLIDMIVHMNTSFKKKATYVSNKEYITKIYFSEKFALDLIAFIPVDYIMLGISLPMSYSYWIKLLRLFKIPRYWKMISLLRENTDKQSNTSLLSFLAIFYIALNHIAACIMHMIASNQYTEYPGENLYTTIAAKNIVDMPLVSQSPATQYVYFFYWACSVSSAGAYGDIGGVTPAEIAFETITMLFFRVYFTFISAEVARIFTSTYVNFKSNLDRKAMYDKWMSHAKLPKSLILRVKKYNEYVFEKYKGLDENKILKELPETTRNEILEFLLIDLLESAEIFPNEEVGLFSNIIKDFEFRMISKDEYVYKNGETAEEVYFVMDGTIYVRNADDTKDLHSYKKNDFFGEVAIMHGKIGVRTNNAKAKADATLAVLNLCYLKDIWQKYPTVKAKMTKIAETRGLYDDNKSYHMSPQSQWFLKDLDLEKPSEYKGNLSINSPHLEPLLKEEAVADLNDTKVVSLKKIEAPGMVSTSSLRLENDCGIIRNNSFDNTAKAGLPKNSWDISLVQRKSLSRVSHQEEVHSMVKRIEGRSESNYVNQLKQGESFEQEKDNGESFGKVNKSFYLSKEQEQEQESPRLKERKFTKRFTMKKKSLTVMGFLLKLEQLFKDVRPLILNLILFFDVILAPLNIALEVATTGPMVYIELTLASILLLNFLLNLKDLIKNRNNPKKVFLGAIALAALGKSAPKKIIPHKKPQADHAAEAHGVNDSHDGGKSEVHGKSKHETTHHEDDHHGGGHGGHGGHGEHEEPTVVTVFMDFIFMIPFTVIFHLFHFHGASTNIFLIALQLVKLFAVEHLTWIFQREAFKKRYALNNILVILYAFLIMNHIIACLFIIMANAKHDVNTTWYAKIPAPQLDFPHNEREHLELSKGSIYVHALYWSYMTTSHIGIGDVSAVNTQEKIFASVVITLSTFLYAFLFGNLASLVDDLTPKFQKEFETNYRKVLEYVKASKLDAFMGTIHKYYNYIWQDSKGLDENVLLSKLPLSLRYDIVYERYKHILTESKFFMDADGNFDWKVFYSFCKKCRYGIFMEGDFLVTIGQEVSDVYIVLDGEAEIVDYNITAKNVKKLHPGDHIGGIIANMIQLMNVKVTKITKVAILSQEVFLQMKEAYPQWYDRIMKHETVYKTMHKYITVFKDRMKEIKQSRAALSDASPSRKIRFKDDLVKKETIIQEIEHSQNDEDHDLVPRGFEQEVAKRRHEAEQNTIVISHRDAQKYQAVPSQDLANPPKIQTKNTAPSLNKDSFFFQSPRIPDSANDSNALPPGDQEPLEDHAANKSNQNGWAELAQNTEPATADAKSSEKQPRKESIEQPRKESLVVKQIPLGALNDDSTQKMKSQFSVTPLRSPTGSDKHLPRNMSTFKPDHENSQTLEPVRKKKSWFASIFNVFRRNKKSIEQPSNPGDYPVLTNQTSMRRASTKGGKRQTAKSGSIAQGLSSSQTLTKNLTLRPAGEVRPGSPVPSWYIQEEGSYGDELNLAGSQQLEPSRKKQNRRQSLKKGPGPVAGFGSKTGAPQMALAEIIREKKKLEAHLKSLKYYIDPNSNWKILYELLHTLSITYSVFALPVYVGFHLTLGWGPILLEALILVEMIMYPICLVRTTQYSDGFLKLQTAQVWKKFVERELLVYAIAIIPINLIFSAGNIDPPLWLEGILRVNRVILIMKISSQFAFFGSKYPQLSRYINVFKPIFYLVFVSHFIACLFSWSLQIEPDDSYDFQYTFIEHLQLNHAKFSLKYMLSLDFILSIATTTGYPELIIYNDYERIVMIILVYLGDALFALILGWFSTNSTALPEKYHYVFKRIRKMDYILDQTSQKRVPHKIRMKIENYFAYIVNTRNSNKSCLEALQNLLPATTLQDMAFQQAQHFHSFPLLREFKNKVLSKEIVKNLRQTIYLPHDYIIMRNSYGTEMYSIAEGTVHMLSPNEKKVIAVLHTGAFFGELGVYTTTKRLTSFVAASFCLIYILDKEALRDILKSFPYACSEFERYSKQRLSFGSYMPRKDRLNKAYSFLQGLGGATAAGTAAETAKILRNAEIPKFLLKNDPRKTPRTPRSEKLSLLSDRRSKEEKLSTERHGPTGEDDDNLSMGSLLDDCVEDEELDHRTQDMKKNSFRVKTKTRERRFSRVQMGREKSVSKAEGLTIRWGINLQ